MEFRLVYQGPLPSESAGDSRKKAKNRIRKVLHVQLAEFWKQITLRNGMMSLSSDKTIPQPVTRKPNDIAELYKRANKDNQIYRFVPIIGERFAVACSLDILFLRRDAPGNLIRHGGDLDNRIKVLFDALRMPHDSRELPDTPPDEGEDPFYCLMEDDKFINAVSVTTETLLTRPDENVSERVHDVLLVRSVKTIVINPLYAPWGLS